MSIIEGIGDEIIHFGGAFLLVVLGIIAWFSTRIADLPQIRTILIVERRSQSEPTQAAANTERTASSNVERNLCENHITSENTSVDSGDKNKVTNQTSELNLNLNQTSETQGTSDDVPNNGVDATNERNSNESSTAQEETNSTENNTDNIRIRLKYLNDDLKLVDGHLQELLGDFKKRHFSVELSRQKIIRLIFNGHVLQSDDQTLQRCGLYDNCVVHCIIHAQQATNRPNSQTHSNAAPPDWNLGFLLYACISFVLGFAWFFRFHYSHLFTLTTTSALVTLTGMFVVSIIGMYIGEDNIPT